MPVPSTPSTVTPTSSQPFFPNIRVTDGSSPYLWQVEPTMVINRSGTIFVGWKETDGPDAAGLRVGASYSVDHGQTWAPNILMNQSHPNQGCANSDPWMALTPSDRVDYGFLEFNCAGTNSGLDVANTSNGNWGTTHFIAGHGGLVDKDSIAVDTSGRLYATWDENNVLAITWSDDGGNTWAPITDPGGVSDIVLGSIVATLGNSTVYLTYWDISTDNIMFLASTNRGSTWSTPVRVNSVSGSAQQVGSWQIPLPTMNVDSASGNLYIAWPDMRDGNQNIYFANSTDGGQTWGTNHRINDDTGSASQWMVDLAVDSTGKVHAAWEDGRTGNWNLFYANSTDGGQTWTANIKVTTAETPITYDRPGDYFALQAGPDNTIYVVWTDGRGADFDIYYARNPGFPSATVTVTTQPSGLTVTVDGVSAKAPVTNTWILDSTHAVSVAQTIPIATGSRYNFTSWSDGGLRSHSIVASTDATITASFRKQYTAQASVSPSGLSFSIDNVSTSTAYSAWWDNGSTHWIATTTPQYTSPQIRYTWASWSDGGALAHAVVASAPISVSGTFLQQQGLLVSTQPGGLNFTFDGANYSSSQTFWLSLDTYHAVSVATLEFAGSGVRYRFASWSDGGAASHVVHFTGATAVTAAFSAEYYLTVTSPVPGAAGGGWFPSGTTATATITYSTYLQDPGTRLVFAGWGGDASGTGTASNPIVMDGPKTAQAVYTTQYYLSVTSAYGTSSGAGWYDAGSTATFAVNASVLSVSPGVRVSFAGWSGNATGTSLSGTFTMDGPRTASAEWEREYLVTVTSDVGTVTGGGWYAAGATVTLGAPAQATANGQTYTFAGWTGDVSGTLANLTFTASRPVSAHATWTPVSTGLGANDVVTWSAIGVVVIIVVAVLIVFLMRRRKRKPEAPKTE